MFRTAGQAEILRSQQKDDFYLSYIRSAVTEVFQGIFGMKPWIHLRQELNVAADLGYFLLTTAAGFQTLGEEYVNTIQVDDTLRKQPSTLRRGIMILLHVLSPYVLQRILEKCRRDLTKPDTHLGSLSPQMKQFLLQIIPVVKQCITFAHRLHLTAFYLQGIFYHVSKRIMGVHYVQFSLKPKKQFEMFRILGWLAAAQLISGALISAYQFDKTWQEVKGQMTRPHISSFQKKSSSNISSNQCSLCLESRQNSTATPCGHLFCWNCILEWCQTKGECPLCREKFVTSRLIYLQNYDM